MKKTLPLLLICLFIFIGIVNAGLEVNVNPDPVSAGESIHVAISGDSYYSYVYVYDSSNVYIGNAELECGTFRCEGDHSFDFSIPSNLESGKAYLRIYDYSVDAGTSKLFGWRKFYFDVGKSIPVVEESGKNITLTCTKETWTELHKGECDPNNCYSIKMNYSRCYTYSNSLLSRILGKAGKSKELCTDSYDTICKDSPKCIQGYKETLVSACESCTDSDGGKDYYQKGKTCQEDDCEYDYCISEDELFEMDCGPAGNQREVHTYNCPNGCQDGACVIDCNSLCQSRYGTGGICGGTVGDIMGSKYCKGDVQCVCIPQNCQEDSDCKQYGAHLKCLNNQCLFPDCDTACKEFYGYSFGFCGADSGIDVGSAYCGHTFKQCMCSGEKSVDMACAPAYDPDILPGDFNEDGIVDMGDFSYFADHIGETPSSPGWDSKYDLNGDKIVDNKDQTIFNGYYGCKRTKQAACTDSDGGKNEFVKGKVVLESGTEYDKCASDNAVTEQYCFYDNKTKREQIAKVKIDCKYGCKDGACVKECNCSQPDCEFDKYGSMCCQKPSDCTTGCVDNKYYSGHCLPLVNRPGNYCDTVSTDNDKNGITDACELNCTDSDGGHNVYVKGTLSGVLTTGERTITTDYCFNDEISKTPMELGKFVSEYYCSGSIEGQFYREEYDCPNGCKDGACVNQTEEQKVTYEGVLKMLNKCRSIASDYNGVPGSCNDACKRFGESSGKTYYCLSAEINLGYDGNRDPDFGERVMCGNGIYGKGRYNCMCCSPP